MDERMKGLARGLRLAAIHQRRFWEWLVNRGVCMMVGHEVQTTIVKDLRGRYVGTDCECPVCGKVFHKERRGY